MGEERPFSEIHTQVIKLVRKQNNNSGDETRTSVHGARTHRHKHTCARVHTQCAVTMPCKCVCIIVTLHRQPPSYNRPELELTVCCVSN